MCLHGKEVELSTIEYIFYYNYNYYIIIMLHKNVSDNTKHIITEPGDIIITILIIITIIIIIISYYDHNYNNDDYIHL